MSATWLTAAKRQIASAILSWPIDLCVIVANYTINSIRWSDRQAPGIRTSADGLESELLQPSGYNGGDFERYGYREVVGDRMLSETSTAWTFYLTNSITVGFDRPNVFERGYMYRFRVGIQSYSSDDRFKFCGPEVRLYASEQEVQTTLSNGRDWRFFRPSQLRYSLSADLAAGVLSASIFETDRPTEKFVWFSIYITPLVLAAAVPVVYMDGEYLGGAGTMAILIP